MSSVSSRIRSRPRKPAWPSLVWKTSGAGGAGDPGVGADRADAADAEQHLLAQPVLGVAAVQPVGDGRGVASLFSSMSESSISSGTRPTWATQIRAVSVSSSSPSLGRPISILATEPSASRSSESGRPSGSRTG